MTLTMDEQLREYRERGVVVIEGAIAGEQLTRLQAATDYWHERSKEEWLEAIASGDACPLWLDVPDALEKEEVFVEMIDHPGYVDLLEAITDGELLLTEQVQVRSTPPWPIAYAGWHSDRVPGGCFPNLQIYIHDVREKGGEFAYVPGSHRTNVDTGYPPRRNDTMPGHLRIPGPAGTAIVFDSAGLHTAMDNETSTPRTSMITGYRKGRLATPDDRFAGAEYWCTTPRRRRVLGLEV